MSKRNFILLIIILSLVVIVIIGFLYFRKLPTAGEDSGGGTNFLSQFNPFGTSPQKPPTTTPPPVVDVSGYEPGAGEETQNAKLMKVSSMPIAGFAVYMKERLKNMPVPPVPPVEPPPVVEVKKGKGTSTKAPLPVAPPTEFVAAVRYVEKAKGNIYQTFADKIEERKFSVTTIPRVYEAYFGNHGESVLMRYLKIGSDTIETFIGNLPKERLGEDTTGNNEVKGSFLPNNVKDISLSPDTSQVFYLFNSGDSMIGTILNFLDNKKVQVFDSPFTEWLSQWGSDKIITLNTKPSANTPGYIYTIDLFNKNVTKTLGDINGLTTLLSLNGKLILYGNNNLSLNIFHTDTKNGDALAVRTLPEKCVWNSGSTTVYCAVPKSIDPGQYPDSWYQGEVSFRDQLWKIDIESGNASIILDPATSVGGEEIDGIKLAVDENENYLFFVNKKDSFLWKLELK